MRRIEENNDKTLSSASVVTMFCFIVFLVIPTDGFCANTPAVAKDMNTVADFFLNTIFATWVTKSLMGVGAAIGIASWAKGAGLMGLVNWFGGSVIIHLIRTIIDYICGLSI